MCRAENNKNHMVLPLKTNPLLLGCWQISRSFRAIACLIIITFGVSSCTTIPTINSNWIAENCKSVGQFTTDSENYSNCSGNDNGTVACNYTNGSRWQGKLLNGRMHGVGQITWTDGTIFSGEMNNEKKWCGVEQNGSTFFVYKNGVAEQGIAGVDWGTVGAAILIIGVIGAAASGGGGSGGSYVPPTDYDWDWDQFYDERFALQWRCRGIQTGQFADNSNCALDFQDDDRWPDK